ncbi:Uma2 family endonuclease [Nocardia huaxiensis]|uniref:Uma2 family endonuclease n=1 Tax=Nocardia huaxiensis TaxID=2755382 RepID=UPI001E3BC7B7|nr:Uma2 family endonuclease [Nocardia huaxiensis]UFT00126.1 Uma2 family endonuclease [Nocardia huaxiensis]
MPVPELDNSAMQPPASDRWTAADLDHLPENGLRFEVLNGQLVVNAAPKPLHQWIVSRLGRALEDALPSGSALLPGVGVLIGDDEPVPDLLVATGPIPWDDRGIPADQVQLLVEVVSKSTTFPDRMTKPVMYAEAGIRNYWRIEPSRFKGQLPGESLPVLFAYVLSDAGECELVQRVPAGVQAELGSPFEFTIDPASLVPGRP